MMKWFAFVGAAFVASSTAITIGSADAESMTEAYPEFHFAQLDLLADLQDTKKKAAVANKAPAKKSPVATAKKSPVAPTVGGTGKDGDPGKGGVPSATAERGAYRTRAKKASADAKKIADEVAALNKETEAKLEAALKELETLKTEQAQAKWAAQQKKENDEIAAKAELQRVAANKLQDDAAKAVKAIQGAVAKKQTLVKKAADKWGEKTSAGKRKAFADASRQRKLDAAHKKADEALAALEKADVKVEALQKKLDNTSNWVSQIKAEWDKLTPKQKEKYEKKLEKFMAKRMKELAKEAKKELKEYLGSLEEQAEETADVCTEFSGEAAPEETADVSTEASGEAAPQETSEFYIDPNWLPPSVDSLFGPYDADEFGPLPDWGSGFDANQSTEFNMELDVDPKVVKPGQVLADSLMGLGPDVQF